MLFSSCNFLTLCSQNGIVFNQKKFQFCKNEVEFAGFIIGENDVRPAPKILDSIQSFPVPKNISDIRGWFGLINQVAPFFANRAVMEPFRQLLKPSSQGKKIYWDDNLTRLFEESKKVIVERIRKALSVLRLVIGLALCPISARPALDFF